MPSIEAPHYYEHAKFTASSRADDFLKWIDEDEFVNTTGTVDSPFGWVGLIEITSDLIATWVSSAGDPWMSESRNFEPGWYIVHIDDLGFVYGEGYGSAEYTLTEEGARADFAEAEEQYGFWDDRMYQ